MSEGQTYEMPTEIVVEFDEDGEREYVEVGVQDGETHADIQIEDADGAVELRFSGTELRDLIASLITALKTVEANS